MKIGRYVLILTVLVFFNISLVSAQNYVRGEILVGFHENVTESEADSLIDSLGLRWESKFPKLFSIRADYMKEITGTEGRELREELAKKIEEEDKKLAQAPYTNYIILNTGAGAGISITFNTRATEEQAKEFLSQFEGLEIISFLYANKYGVVSVPWGKEQEWIDTFEEQPIVSYAELNYVGTLESVTKNYIKPALIILGIIVLVIIIYLIRKKRKQMSELMIVRKGKTLRQDSIE
tara:strand:+ start:683 stop:1390 length:708 start_codon:yes stop_codon:yes gene_type:complete